MVLGTNVQQQDVRHRLMITFRIDGDLRFISHLDTLRLFRRACARGRVPVRFSQGFNPQPRISLSLPRPVGVASDAEALVIETDQPIEPADVLKRLKQQMPQGIEMIGARRLGPGEKPQPKQVRYRLELGHPAPPDWKERIGNMLRADNLTVERTDPKDKSIRHVNVRPYLVDIHADGEAAEFTLRITEGGTARPAELAGLLGCDSRVGSYRIRRLEIQWR